MRTTKLLRSACATILLLLPSQRATAQSLNWVHQPTGVQIGKDGGPGSIAIGFTGPWVNVFYEQTVGQNTEVRGVRQFPAANPINNTQYIPYPAPLTTFPSNVAVELRSVAHPFHIVGPSEDFALSVRDKAGIHPGETFLISTANPLPDPLPGVEAVAYHPHKDELFPFHASDLVGIMAPMDLVAAGATDLDVALVEAKLVNAQNNIYEIRYHQTAFGTGVYLPPVVVASLPGRTSPPAVDFTMTAGGIPYVVFSHPGTRQVIARQFDPKINAWTTSILDSVAGIAVMPCNFLVSRGELVAATWAAPNPNNPNATALDLRVAIKDGDGPWQTSTVCTACVGNPEQLDITFGPDSFPVIAYVSPTNQLMVAYDPLSPEPALPGDVNLDGVVNRSDVALMALNYATAGFSVNSTTDLDGDHRVVLADLAILQAHLGQYLAAPSPGVPLAQPVPPAAIPEPPTIWLAIFAILAAATAVKPATARA